MYMGHIVSRLHMMKGEIFLSSHETFPLRGLIFGKVSFMVIYIFCSKCLLQMTFILAQMKGIVQ
jgi:hypothetical protein